MITLVGEEFAYTQPELSSAAFVTIDVQSDTLAGGALEVPGTSAILPLLRAVAAAFRRSGLPIVHMVRIYRSDGSNADACRRILIEEGAKLLLEGTPGCQIAPEILPAEDVRLDSTRLLAGEIQEIGPREAVIYKPRWGAFYGTPLDSYLKRLEVSTLVFAGCNFPNCPRTSIYEASERDFRIVVVEDAISRIYRRGLEELVGIGCIPMSAAGLVDRLPGRRHQHDEQEGLAS